jgi:hypothetical protein
MPAVWCAAAWVTLAAGTHGAFAQSPPPSYKSIPDAYRAERCDGELVICVDREGKLIQDPVERLPAVVHPGDKVVVLVITNKVDDRNTISVAFSARKSLDQLFASHAAPPEKGPPPTYVVLSFVSDPVPDDVVDFMISFQRRTTDTENGAESQQIIPVELGYSYFSVALLVAVTFKGDRHVLGDLTTTADHAVDPGLALNIFPFGRQRGVIGYFRKCFDPNEHRCLANMIGLQIATDLDLTNPTDKLYAGLVFEPIAGLALTGGVSLRKVAVVPAAGAIPATESVGGAVPADTRYVMRGYVGVTMTLDLLNAISSEGTKIKNVKVP